MAISNDERSQQELLELLKAQVAANPQFRPNVADVNQAFSNLKRALQSFPVPSMQQEPKNVDYATLATSGPRNWQTDLGAALAESYEAVVSREDFKEEYMSNFNYDPESGTKQVTIPAIYGDTLANARDGITPLIFHNTLRDIQLTGAESGNGEIRETLLMHRLNASRKLCQGCDTCPKKVINTSIDADARIHAHIIKTVVTCDGVCPQEVIDKQRQLTKQIRNICRDAHVDPPSWIKEVLVRQFGQTKMTINSSKPMRAEPDPLTPEQELAMLTKDVEEEGLKPIF